ncbi:leucyl aminopeptidase [Caldimonas manganoxidans]|uniref:leucyl aminopeptidase n=1 Tax=Caldimonas manganoxidans TaxID=196015 RepID=UPI0003A304C1
MDFRALPSSPALWAETPCDAMVVVLNAALSSQDLPAPLAGLLADALKTQDLALKAGRSLYLHRPAGLRAPRLVFTVAADGSAKAYRHALSAAMPALKHSAARHLAVTLPPQASWSCAHAHALVSALEEAVYVYRHTKPSAPPAPAVSKVSLLVGKDGLKAVQHDLAQARAIGLGVAVAREWANRPGNHCTPTHLADEARRLGRAHGLKVEVLDRKAVEKLGMGAFLAVAQGSEQPLRFIVMRYDGGRRGEPPHVLVGKGITFDTGGISIKPAAEMDEMKFDMSGAASVLGTMRALAELKPRVNVVGLIPACENMPDGRSVKPGDVVTSLSGQTIEILNTDAEGRLILCDALTYAERFKPASVVDIATLTGACVIALGHHHSGLFTADDALAEALQTAGREALDTCWRMPLDEEYDEALKSNFADMANVGGRAGGAITAAMFLRRFAGKYRWAHLDIAGTAWKSGAAKGATGRPVALLTRYLLNQAR